jgi:3-oxoacid CoA-transferase subunit B
MALDKIGIAKRIAQELKDRYFVNLGIGSNIGSQLYP